jgi:hypothetical protein
MIASRVVTTTGHSPPSIWPRWGAGTVPPPYATGVEDAFITAYRDNTVQCLRKAPDHGRHDG